MAFRTTQGENHPPVPDKDLGLLKRTYRARPELPFWGVMLMVLVLVIYGALFYQTLEALIHSTPWVLPLPLWGMSLLLCAGLLVLVLLGWLTLRYYRNRHWSIFLYERGICEEKRSGLRALRWEEVKYLRYSEEVSMGTTFPTYRYRIQAQDGQTIDFNAAMGEHADLFASVTQQAMPYLLAQARERYQVEQEASFERLGITRAGIKDKQNRTLLPWSKVKAVKVLSSGKLVIKEQNARLAWFNDFIPNVTVFQRLADEILQASSIQGR
jgi:hypothetical protein